MILMEQFAALAIGVLGFALVNLFLLVMLLRRRGSDEGTRCGACEHAATGLTGPRCPECGARFRRAGILTGRLRSGLSTRQMTGGLLVANAILFGVGMALFQMELEKRFPSGISMYQASASLSLKGRHITSTPGSMKATYRVELILPQTGMEHQGEFPAGLYPDLLQGQPAFVALLPTGNSVMPMPLKLETAADKVLMTGQVGSVLVIPDAEDVTDEDVMAWLDELDVPWTESALEKLKEHKAEMADVIVMNIQSMAARKGVSAYGNAFGGASTTSQYLGMVSRAGWVAAASFGVVGGLFLLACVAIGWWGIRRRARIRGLSA
ncbi:MAG: hypothetical protein MK085_08865 [Phycisphaerales bacterium]|nr:hypothetical protein [Phycisphaerales bacterium]